MHRSDKVNQINKHYLPTIIYTNININTSHNCTNILFQNIHIHTEPDVFRTAIKWCMLQSKLKTNNLVRIEFHFPFLVINNARLISRTKTRQSSSPGLCEFTNRYSDIAQFELA